MFAFTRGDFMEAGRRQVVKIANAIIKIGISLQVRLN
jgi:hypothetical protein